MKKLIVFAIFCVLVSGPVIGSGVSIPNLIDNNIKLSKQASPQSREAYRSDREYMQRHIRRLESQVIDLRYDRDQQETKIAELETQQVDVDMQTLTYMKNYLALIEFCEVLFNYQDLETPSALAMIKRDIVDAIRDLGYSVEGDDGNEPDASPTEGS